MDYKTLLVHLELNGDNEGVLKIAGELAQRFQAKVIGIAAAQPVRPLYDESCTSAEVMAEDQAEIDQEIGVCVAQFRQALEGKATSLEWRSTVTFDSLDGYIADQARCADLIITGKDIGGALFDTTRRVNIGRLAVMAGRPLLLVPQGIVSLSLENVFLAWKDTREARRAAMDSLPLLRAAGHVTVAEVTPVRDQAAAEKRLTDVGQWLDRHGIAASRAAIATPHSQEGVLRAELVQRRCDLLVAGAYGHARLGEWVFGGMTEDVLLDPDFCVLLSH
jgi:nucleotide-binding universal stress UspA family protein